MNQQLKELEVYVCYKGNAVFDIDHSSVEHSSTEY